MLSSGGVLKPDVFCTGGGALAKPDVLAAVGGGVLDVLAAVGGVAAVDGFIGSDERASKISLFVVALFMLVNCLCGVLTALKTLLVSYF